MKKYVKIFLRRGLTAFGFGPVVLAALYWIMKASGQVETLAVDRGCVGIITISARAFIAGGMNVVYQIERLPLTVAVLLHGAVLYVGYLVTYLINGWLERGAAPVLVFTAIFVVGYLTIWGIIYAVVRKHTKKINEKLMQTQMNEEELSYLRHS